ncbi:MAG: glutathione S-transferase family protein [Alphaproteobacteria bacterium]|nr:glutathione S-transferase family protein [Alphaproteobacteria bacterium]
MHLIIANKLYSSWSMRPWLVMRAAGIAFEETVVPLRQADTKERIRRYSPTGLVPVLIDGDAVVWESLAIISYLADRFSGKGIFPAGSNAARAHAKAISVEMHGGFRALRQACPMNLGKRFATPAISDEVQADVARLEFIWRDTRQRFGGSGGYLFGDFSAADAMYAPVVTRLDTYQLPVADDTRTYMDTVLSDPVFLEWKHAALHEPWTIEAYEEGHRAIEDYRAGSAG